MFHLWDWTEYTRNIRNILFPQDFDKHEMLVYEEVARMPPFHRKTLVLVGKIVDKIINNTVLIFTSCWGRSGVDADHSSSINVGQVHSELFVRCGLSLSLLL